MFDKKKIDLIYRIVCLITFCIVTMLVKSIITLSLLLLFFYLMVYKEKDFAFLAVCLITFIAFAIAIATNNYFLLRLMIMVGYAYYFLYIPSISTLVSKAVDKVYDKKVQTDDDDTDEEIIRFKKKAKKRVNKNDFNLPGTLYLTFHLGVLFLLILVG